MQRDCYWPSIANKVFRTVSGCRNFGNTASKLNYKRHLQLFRGGTVRICCYGCLESATQDDKGQPARRGFTDRFSKLIRAVSTAAIITTAVACTFFDVKVVLYIVQSYILTDNGTQFVSKLFGILCIHIAIKHKAKTAYH